MSGSCVWLILFFLCIKFSLDWTVTFGLVCPINREISNLEFQLWYRRLFFRKEQEWVPKLASKIFETLYLEGEQEKSALAQKFAVCKKSTIFLLSSWNLLKIIISWLSEFARISARLDEIVDFLLKAKFCTWELFFY